MTLSTLDAQRQATASLIAQEGRDIELHRPATMVADGAGGMKRSSEDSTVQQPVRRFFGTSTSGGFHIQRDMGERHFSVHVLMGLHDDPMQEDDYFYISGRKFDVLFIYPDRSFETRAEVVALGG